jgi:hypothetical protein
MGLEPVTPCVSSRRWSFTEIKGGPKSLYTLSSLSPPVHRNTRPFNRSAEENAEVGPIAKFRQRIARHREYGFKSLGRRQQFSTDACCRGFCKCRMSEINARRGSGERPLLLPPKKAIERTMNLFEGNFFETTQVIELGPFSEWSSFRLANWSEAETQSVGDGVADEAVPTLGSGFALLGGWRAVAFERLF